MNIVISEFKVIWFSFQQALAEVLSCETFEKKIWFSNRATIEFHDAINFLFIRLLRIKSSSLNAADTFIDGLLQRNSLVGLLPSWLNSNWVEGHSFHEFLIVLVRLKCIILVRAQSGLVLG